MNNFVLTSTLWRHWRRGWGCSWDCCCSGSVWPGWSGFSGTICSVCEGCSERGRCPADESGPGKRRRPFLGLIKHCWSDPEPEIKLESHNQRERGRLWRPGCWCWSDGESLWRLRPCRWPSPCLSSTYRNISGDTPELLVRLFHCHKHQQTPATTTVTRPDLISEQIIFSQALCFQHFDPGSFIKIIQIHHSIMYWFQYQFLSSAYNLIKYWNNNLIGISLKVGNRFNLRSNLKPL